MYWGAYPPVRRVEYDRDILDRVTEVRAEVADQMQPILTDIQYRADGQITAATFGNGLRETRTYDQQGRLVYQDLKVETDLIIGERTYTYDPSGNITARTGTPGDQHYTYDALDRLTGQDINESGKTWQYDYGPNHNRQTRTDGDGLSEFYSYKPDSNRLTNIDKLFGTPDPETPTSRQFVYNQANRFSEYVEDGETVATYTYNALGQRTRKEVQSETTLFHLDIGISLLGESDDAGNQTRDYLWLNNRPIGQIEFTGLMTYLHTDHLRTPRIGTSDAQTIVWQWEVEAFGDIEAAGAIEINLRLPGQYFDAETNQHYNYLRDYMPVLGKYIQSDPLGIAGGQNAFIYANSNSLKYIDPFGRTGFEELNDFCVADNCICTILPFLCGPPPTARESISFIANGIAQNCELRCSVRCVANSIVGDAASQATNHGLQQVSNSTVRDLLKRGSVFTSRNVLPVINVYSRFKDIECIGLCILTGG